MPKQVEKDGGGGAEGYQGKNDVVGEDLSS